jgi:hypothetical protein
MGEAKRRRAARAGKPSEKPSQGPAQASSPRHWELTRISGEMIRTRHPEADTYFKLITHAIARVQDASREPVLCVVCNCRFACHEIPEEFIICKPFAANDGRTAFASALCQRCASHPDIFDRIIAAYRERLFRDMAILAFADLGSGERRQ